MLSTQLVKMIQVHVYLTTLRVSTVIWDNGS